MPRKRGRPKKDVPREPSGRPSRMSKATIADNMSVAIEARARHAIMANPPKRSIGEDDDDMSRHVKLLYGNMLTVAKQPWYGCNAGRRIANEEDAADLWDVIQMIRRRRRAWLLSIGQSDHPSIAKLELLPEPFEASGDDAPADLRTEAEKAQDAERAWMAIVYATNTQPLLLRFLELAVVLDENVPGPLAETLRWIAKEIG